MQEYPFSKDRYTFVRYSIVMESSDILYIVGVKEQIQDLQYIKVKHLPQ